MPVKIIFFASSTVFCGTLCWQSFRVYIHAATPYNGNMRDALVRPAAPVQRKLPAHPLPHLEEDEELLQRKAAAAPNRTGLPDQLKTGVEALSGMSLDHVRVHRNSDKPAQMNAHAYAQGSEIHLAAGQEKHLPHEAWHVVQQAQGRVKPTMQMKNGVAVNEDVGLEHEADVMGVRALSKVVQTSPRLVELNRSDPIRT